jgi:transposase
MHRALIHYRHFLPSLRKVSAIYGVGKSTLSRWASKASNTPPRKLSRKKRPTLVERVSMPVADLLVENPFHTLKEIVARIRGEGIQISSTTAHRALRHASFTRKRVRNRFQPRKPTSAEAKAFLERFNAAGEIISVDETCIYVNDRDPGERREIPASAARSRRALRI